MRRWLARELARSVARSVASVVVGLATTLVVSPAAVATAQTGLRVTVAASPNGAVTLDGPTVMIANVFADERSAELLASSVPASVTVTVELWGDRRLFDRLVSSAEVRRVVRFDPLSHTYRLGRITPDSVVEEARVPTLAEVQARIGAPLHVLLPPPRGQRGLYYTARVTIETLNSDDLAELQRWLQGEVRPAFRGEKNPGSPLTRGIRTVISRLLGGDVKRVEGRSAVFDT